MIFEEKTIKSEKIYQGKIINLRRDTVKALNGVATREIIEHSGGAVIAALTEDGKLLMIRQYRCPAKGIMFEVPAGKLDAGEEPQTAALRELKEETGFSAQHIEFLTKMYPSVGYSEEILYLYLCTDLVEGETNFDPDESIELETYSINELYNMVMAGEITDGKTQVAVLMVKGLLEEGKLQPYLK